jgi:hypothetical protein
MSQEIFIAAVTSLMSNYLARKVNYKDKESGALVKCAVEMGSDAMLFIPGFVKIG